MQAMRGTRMTFEKKPGVQLWQLWEAFPGNLPVSPILPPAGTWAVSTFILPTCDVLEQALQNSSGGICPPSPKLIAEPDDHCYSYLDFCVDHPRQRRNIA